MSVKDCGKHHSKWPPRLKRFAIGLLIFNFILLLIILLAWAIIQPHKPRFILQDVTVYAFNASVPNFLTSNFQVTIYSRNPNDKLGIYYDHLDTYATYHSQQITLRTSIPSSYQGHKEVDVWSPLISGTYVPVAPYNSIALTQDQSTGAVSLLIKIDGRVRWKLSTYITGKYHLHVKCPAFITFGSRTTGISVGENAIKYQLVQRCSVSV
ncbi:hypothetical protein BT93_L1630 [Corymbia citriodora subsp. variegata]|uniref:Late embryogenesis abundant protein LEA-2 subgroup domain-containing protein n=1 Tax=Corymbia citriodora subsp. variegata TaxID=360336 RepID=A0A8T0CZY5_CORYI|nr:hypothetical protein BT93_L1630 [Corymbia citriodora subsp. variegata]